MWGAIIPAAASLIGGMMASKGGSQDQAKVEPWGPAEPYMKDLMSQAQQLYGMGSMNPAQMLALQNQLGYWEQAAPGMVGETQGAWRGLLNPWGQAPMEYALKTAQGMAGGAENPYAQTLMDMTRGQMTQAYEQSILPNLTHQAISAGGLGGSADAIAKALASERFAEELGNQQNQLAANFYAQNLGQQQYGLGALSSLMGLGFGTQAQAAQMGPGMTQFGGMPSSQVYDVGSLYQAAPWQNLQNYSGIVGPMSGLSSIPQGPGVGQQIGGQLLGMGLQGLGSYFSGGGGGFGGMMGGGA